ncbi:MAG: TetR family transcriptional regulator [Paenibacillus sp.]|jgi:AcrR family transcriptional regulator|nr:TetR family transcriptional regulator [Paenibacillus sp.]
MRKGEQTREHIIETAAQVLNQRGFYASSLSEIMEVTGLKKGGIYNHFESKDEIISQVFSYCVKEIRLHFDDAIAAYSHSVDQLIAIVSVAQDLFRGIPLPGGCAIMNAAIEADDAHPFLKKQADLSMDKFQSLIAGIIEQGKSANEIKQDVNAAETAIFLIAAMEGSLMMSKLSENEQAVNVVIQYLTHYLNAQVRQQ